MICFMCKPKLPKLYKKEYDSSTKTVVNIETDIDTLEMNGVTMHPIGKVKITYEKENNNADKTSRR